MKLTSKVFPLLGLSLALLSACDGGSGSPIASSAAPFVGSNAPTLAGKPTTSAPRTYQTDVLLFVGSGTWAAELTSLRTILSSHGATVTEVSSAQLEAMTVDQVAQYGAMIFPGGSGGTEARSLSAAAHARLREAVQVRGVSYVGFCAGSFIAAAPQPAPGQDVSYGLGVVDGPVLDYYYLSDQGKEIEMTLESFPDGSTKDLLWYGGPVTPNVSGGVIAKYPDGNPAISEMWSGNGFVVLSGPHPTATQAILSGLGVSSSDGTHTDLAWDLIFSALHQQPMPAF